MLRVARQVAKDRVIFTVDSQVWYGYGGAAYGFGGFRVMSRSTGTGRSSPPRRSPRAIPVTRPRPLACSPKTYLPWTRPPGACPPKMWLAAAVARPTG